MSEENKKPEEGQQKDNAPRTVDIKFRGKTMALDEERIRQLAQIGLSMETKEKAIADKQAALEAQAAEQQRILQRGKPILEWYDQNPEVRDAMAAYANGDPSAMAKLLRTNTDGDGDQALPPAPPRRTQDEIATAQMLKELLDKTNAMEQRFSQKEKADAFQAALANDPVLKSADAKTLALAERLARGYMADGSEQTEAILLASSDVKDHLGDALEARRKELQTRNDKTREVPPSEGSFDFKPFDAPELDKDKTWAEQKPQRRKHARKWLLDQIQAMQSGGAQ